MKDAKETLEVKQWLRELRTHAGLSQEALAEIVGVTRRTILNAESRNAGLPEGLTFLRILRELGALSEQAPAPSNPLAELRAEAELVRHLLADGFDSLRLTLERIEAQLPEQDEQDRATTS